MEGDEGERVAGARKRGLVLVLETHGQDLIRSMVNIMSDAGLVELLIGGLYLGLTCSLHLIISNSGLYRL